MEATTRLIDDATGVYRARVQQLTDELAQLRLQRVNGTLGATGSPSRRDPIDQRLGKPPTFKGGENEWST